MIPNDKKHAERKKLSSFVPKPEHNWFSNDGNPEGMGLHQMQRNKNKRNTKKKR